MTKEIKVYGTLTNHTVDTTLTNDGIHNDALAYAKQLYDDLFGESKKVKNFLDVINKRVKGITRDTNGDTPGTHINEDLYVDGDIWIKVNGQWKKLDLGDIINRLEILESYWKIDSDDKLVPKDSNRAVKAAGFYDTTV